MKLDHLINAPGKGIKCSCGQPACYFMRCRKCKGVVASCGGHNKSIEQTTQEHCK